MARVLTVRYKGEQYEIPEIWMAGFCRGGKHPMDAIAWWHEQEMLARAWEVEHR